MPRGKEENNILPQETSNKQEDPKEVSEESDKKRKIVYLDMTELPKYTKAKETWQKTVKTIQGEDLDEDAKLNYKIYKIVDVSMLFSALKHIQYTVGMNLIEQGYGIVVEDLEGKQYKINLNGEVSESEIIYSGSAYPSGWEPLEERVRLAKVKKQVKADKEPQRAFVRKHFDEYRMIIARDTPCWQCPTNTQTWRSYEVLTLPEILSNTKKVRIREQVQCGSCTQILSKKRRNVAKEDLGYYEITSQDYEEYYKPKF